MLQIPINFIKKDKQLNSLNNIIDKQTIKNLIQMY